MSYTPEVERETPQRPHPVVVVKQALRGGHAQEQPGQPREGPEGGAAHSRRVTSGNSDTPESRNGRKDTPGRNAQELDGSRAPCPDHQTALNKQVSDKHPVAAAANDARYPFLRVETSGDKRIKKGY